MKTAVCLILCVLLLEQVNFLSASDDDDFFASFLPKPKEKPSKGTKAKRKLRKRPVTIGKPRKRPETTGTPYVSTHAAARITGSGTVAAASKKVITTSGPGTFHTETHVTSTKRPPEEPEEEEEEPVKTEDKGRKRKRKGPDSGEGEGHPTAAPKKPEPTTDPPQSDFDRLEERAFQADDGYVVY